MLRVQIDVGSCDRSPRCPARRACPRGAIEAIEGGTYPRAKGYRVIEDKCSGCGACMRVCAGGAVTTG